MINQHPQSSVGTHVLGGICLRPRDAKPEQGKHSGSHLPPVTTPKPGVQCQGLDKILHVTGDPSLPQTGTDLQAWLSEFKPQKDTSFHREQVCRRDLSVKSDRGPAKGPA